MAALVGYLCAAVCIVFYGSNFTVVAKYDPGDGMFFQLAMCLGIWCTGLFIFVVRGAPTFYPWAMVGGLFWSTGNCCAVYIIKTIGLGPGLVTWGSTNLIIGWLTGFFGFFGLHSDQACLAEPWLNVMGFALALCALADSTFVRKGVPLSRRALMSPGAAESGQACLPPAPAAEAGQLPGRSLVLGPRGDGSEDPAPLAARGGAAADAVSEPVTPRQRYGGMVLSVFSGCCYGLNFLPFTFIQDNYAGASQDGMDYVFNEFCGILVASILYFLMYCAYMRNEPAINPKIAAPAFLCGVMWAVAQAANFMANVYLGYSAAYPLCVVGPGIVASLWSVFLFKDVYGARNYVFLASYFLLTCSSCVCIVLSRKQNC